MVVYERVNTRITVENNNWLNEHSQSKGITKSALINLAIESYKQQSEIDHNAANQKIMQQIDRLEEIIQQLVDQKHD